MGEEAGEDRVCGGEWAQRSGIFVGQVDSSWDTVAVGMRMGEEGMLRWALPMEGANLVHHGPLVASSCCMLVW